MSSLITSLALRPWSSIEWERSEEHTFELQSHHDLVCRLLLEKKKTTTCPAVPARPPTRGLHSASPAPAASSVSRRGLPALTPHATAPRLLPDRKSTCRHSSY